MTTAPLPATVAYVAFGSRTATAPSERSESWPALAERLTRHARRPGKDGPGWSPAAYKRTKDGKLLTRANDSVRELTCAVADVDHVELDDVVALREHVRDLGLACAIYSTHSSSETAPRVRVVVPLAKPVPAETWPRLWPALAERLWLGLADPAASDASRFYYLPAAPPDALTIAERWDGLALDWHDLPLADPQPAPDPVLTTGAGPAETVDPADMPILERLFSGRRGEQRMRAWTGDYADFGGNASSADQSIANGLVAYCRGDFERAMRIMRSGAWRPKWDERRGSTTWLGYTFGKALAAYRAWAGKQDAPEEPEASEDTAPADETCEQKVLRLERELAQERRAHARTRTVNATQMTVIRAQRSEIERLNRQIYADYRLGKVKTYTSSQKEAIRGLVNLAPKRAEHFDTDTPIITDATLAAEMGKCNKTANSAAETVCNLPGSPIKRVMASGGKYGQVTTYELAVRDPVAILEQFVVIAESMEAKVSSRPQPPKCQKHPDAPVNIIHECSRCHEIVELQPLCGKIVHIAADSPPVNEPVLVHGQTVHIAPPRSLLDYAALRPPETPKSWRCTARLDSGAVCGSLERDGDHCDGCNAPIATPMQSRPGKLPDYFRLPNDLEMGPDPTPDLTSTGRTPCCKGISGDGYGAWRNIEDGRAICVTCGTGLRWGHDGYLRVEARAVMGAEE